MGQPLLARWMKVAQAAVVVVAALAPGAAVASAGPAPGAAPIAAANAMWVWQSHPPTELASDAASLDVSRVYLFVGARSHTTNVRIKQSVALLHDEGVSVYALSGQPGWTLHHKPARKWAKRALRLAPFDGLFLDVEPYALKNWKDDQQADIAAYLTLLDELGALPGPLEVDVQFAMGAITTPDGTFGSDILARVDGVTVMIYRDFAFGSNSMWAISQDWLAQATTADKPVWLAAETNRVHGCSYCTFYADGQADVADVLSQVDAAAAAQYPTYQGFAIEDLDGWESLGP